MKKKDELKLVKIDSEYCDFLRTFDSKVPYNFNKKANRPFVGVLFEVNECKYFAPLTSPKPKHRKMKNTIDFLRLKNGTLGAINFNNMIPVKMKHVDFIDLEAKCHNKSEERYQKLLREQIYWLNRHDHNLYSRARKLYYGYINKTLSKSISERCCDFLLLEEKCDEY